MPRAARILTVLATLAVSLSCQTVSDPFPPQAVLNFDITNSTTATQLVPLPAPQVVNWKVEEMTASNITGYSGSYSFLYSGPCFYQLNVLAPATFSAVCRSSGLTLAPSSGARTADLRLTLSRLELRTAARPDLSPGADPDGDGVPNAIDNCPIVFNPDQANFNPNGEIIAVGDACSKHDGLGHPTIADQDLDGVPDVIDNCLWYPNPAPPNESAGTDTDHDGIGDACERVAAVTLPNGRLTVECDGVAFSTSSAGVSLFRMDFGRPGVLSCDAGFTGCTINPDALRVSAVGSSTTFACHQVP